MRRALGFRLTTQRRHLMSFVGFCEDRSADHVTAELAIEWATRTTRGSRGRWGAGVRRDESGRGRV
jgi:hypothetical protein